MPQPSKVRRLPVKQKRSAKSFEKERPLSALAFELLIEIIATQDKVIDELSRVNRPLWASAPFSIMGPIPNRNERTRLAAIRGRNNGWRLLLLCCMSKPLGER